jgi:hypothetical protein
MEQVERKVTAILAANVAGYSRLMAADEQGTLGKAKAEPRYGSAGWYAPPGVDLSAFGERGWL